MFLIFDTETTGLPKKWNAPISDTDNWPRCVQIAWQLHDDFGALIEHQDFLIKPEDFNIPFDAEKIHGISTQLAKEKGYSLITQTNPGSVYDVINLFEKNPKCYLVLVKRNIHELASEIFIKDYNKGNTYSYDPIKIIEYINFYNE